MKPIKYKKRLKRQKKLYFEQDRNPIIDMNMKHQYGKVFSAKFHGPVVQLPDYEYHWVDVQYPSEKLLWMLINNGRSLVYIRELKERLVNYLSREVF